MPKRISLNREAGNVPTWADQEAERLAKLPTFQPGGHRGIGSARASRGLDRQLRKAGIEGNYACNIVIDIFQLARLKAVAYAAQE